MLAAYRLLTSPTIDEKAKQQALAAIAAHHTNLRQLDKIHANYRKNGDYSDTFKTSLKQVAENLVEYQKETAHIKEMAALDWAECLQRFSKEPRFEELAAETPDFHHEYLEWNAVFSALLQADRGSFNAWETPKYDIKLDTATVVKKESIPKL